MIPPCGALIKASKCRKTQEECIWFDACKDQNLKKLWKSC